MTSMNNQLRNELRLMLDKAQSIISSHNLANSNSTSQSSMPDLLSGLPIEQQISIYKNSVTALRSRIDALTFLLQRENEIRTKKEVLYQLKMENSKLRKYYNNSVKRIDNYDIEKKNNYIIDVMRDKIGEEKRKLREMKNIEKEIREKIKKQDNEICAMNLQCGFVKENIEMKKNKKNANEDNDISKEIEDLNGKVTELGNTIRTKKNQCEFKIRNQNNTIKSLMNEIEMINQKQKNFLSKKKIKEYFKCNKFSLLKKIQPQVNKSDNRIKRPISSTYKKLNVSSMKTTPKTIAVNKSFVIAKKKSQLIDNNNITSTEINVSSSTNTNTTLQKDKRKRSLTPLKINRLLSGIDKSSMEMYKTANNLKILNTQI